MDGPSAPHMVYIGTKLMARTLMLLEHRIQKRSIGLCLQQRQQSLDRFANIPAQPQVELRSTAQALSADIDLHNLRGGRKERLVGEIRAEEDKHVALMHRLVRS